jgi:hypothetical protein
MSLGALCEVYLDTLCLKSSVFLFSEVLVCQLSIKDVPSLLRKYVSQDVDMYIEIRLADKLSWQGSGCPPISIGFNLSILNMGVVLLTQLRSPPFESRRNSQL